MIRAGAAMAVVACSTVLFISQSHASTLSAGLGADVLVYENFDRTSLPATLTPLVAESSSALLPCITTITKGAGQCSASGDLLGAGGYTYWTLAAQHLLLPLG